MLVTKAESLSGQWVMVRIRLHACIMYECIQGHLHNIHSHLFVVVIDRSIFVELEVLYSIRKCHVRDFYLTMILFLAMIIRYVIVTHYAWYKIECGRLIFL